MLLKVALHAHTRRSDGALAPDEMLRLHAEAGFDVVAMTDHDLELKHEDIEKLAVPEGLMVLRGSEVSFRELYWQHVGHIWGETKVLKILNHPRRYGMTPNQIEEALKKFSIDAFEITDQGTYCPQYEIVNFPRVSTDDSHYAFMIGKSYMMVEVAEKTGDAIIQAVLNRNVEIKTTK